MILHSRKARGSLPKGGLLGSDIASKLRLQHPPSETHRASQASPCDFRAVFKLSIMWSSHAKSPSEICACFHGRFKGASQPGWHAREHMTVINESSAIHKGLPEVVS